MSFLPERKLQLSSEISQKLIPNQQMQQSFHVLKLPISELSLWLYDQILCNPALEWESNPNDKTDSFLYADKDDSKEEYFFIKKPTTKEVFFEQIQYTFSQKEEYSLAKDIFESIDSKGFLPQEDQERLKDHPLFRRVLYQFKRIPPYGIGASSLQESLLIQLESLHKKNSLAYEIIENHYPLLLKGNVLLLSKALKASTQNITKAIQKDLKPLRISSPFDAEENPHFLIPDLTISMVNENWRIEIHDEILPSFKISSTFLNKIEKASKESLPYLNGMLASAKFLQSCVEKRRETLKKIAGVLIKKQKPFLSGESTDVKPIYIKEIAEELDLHPSTISRAIIDKVLHCYHGTFYLKNLISSSFCQAEKKEEISKSFALSQLKKLIAEEDKTQPLSDQQLLLALKQKGIHCARRTIAKYRNTLSIPNVAKRRRFY